MLNTSPYEKLQKALIDARQQARLTQQEVALYLKRPQSFVSKYESGERKLDVIEFLEVCKILHAKPHSILQKLGAKNIV